MKILLEFYLRYLDFIYLNPDYRITNSRTSGSDTINASLTVTGPILSWQIANDRGQILFDVAPTKSISPDNWFRVPIVRQYLDGYDETNVVSPAESVAWIRDNAQRIEDLFVDSSAAQSCKALTALEEANALKYWGPPR
ncbi:hypothetical protein [Mycolicibacter heraklionensis]|uniref:Uncharacterized protein n=1 Tax=Mycolicibacter heraklionensis TaxID=512402 RepID=A0AA91EVU1_9MYCO|nr:hypothetical protein [Mycolicibacter heraklionensis]OBK80291.1 hypothetical protein A5649_12775 [Mycolicibacter heraklionensis]